MSTPHPSGAFSLLLPRTWTLYEQTTGLFALLQFLLRRIVIHHLVQISVVNFGREIAADESGDIMMQYQSNIRPDINRYTEQDRQAMGDGSWRISGLRQNSR